MQSRCCQFGCLSVCPEIGTWFIKGRKSEASQTSATAAQNGSTPINETPGRSPDGTTPTVTSISIDGALLTEANAATEEPTEVTKSLKLKGN